MILVISNTLSRGEVYANALRYFGIVTFIETQAKALSEISPSISAVLITTPNAIADECDYVSRIKSYNSSVPVFAIKNGGCKAYDLCISPDVSPSLVYEAMQEYMKISGLKPLGVYKLAGLDVSIGQRMQSYSFLDIKFTDSELFIIRYLIKAFPIRRTTRDILKYAYPRKSQSCESVVRTHISKINKKFAKLTGRNLINSETCIGYAIDTPIKPEILWAK